MPNYCVARNCSSKTDVNRKISFFKFPNDEMIKQLWIKKLKINITSTTNKKVCEKHFKKSDILREKKYLLEKGEYITESFKKPQLKKTAIPIAVKNGIKSRQKINDAKKDLKNKENPTGNFKNLSDLEKELNKIDSDFWDIIKKENKITFLHINYNEAPEILISVKIDSNLSVSTFSKNVLVNTKKKNDDQGKVRNIKHLIEILQEAEKLEPRSVLETLEGIIERMSDNEQENRNSILFLTEQIQLHKTVNHGQRYSAELLVYFSLLQSMAPHAYKFLRQSGYLILPHPNTLKRICSSPLTRPLKEQLDNMFLSHIKQKFQRLKDLDKTITILLDEIHIKPFFDYKGGNIAGMSFNSKKAATSAHVFMISSVLSEYKDVVHIMPVHSLQAKDLFTFTRKIIVELENIGFSVIAVTTDNNSINRKAMSYFSDPPNVNSIVYQHPSNPLRPLFLMMDSVHLLKDVRNNWINQNSSGKCMVYPAFNENSEPLKTASFNAIQDLYEIESNGLLKFGYNLSRKALSPNNFEKQNVNLVLQIFNDFLPEALLQLGPEHNLEFYEDTAEFIKIINLWWKIVNVKSCAVGTRKRDDFKKPLQMFDNNYTFLTTFLDWLDAWKNVQIPGKLTEETHSALFLTTYAITEIVKYCSNELGMMFILPGKFQTDGLEARFGIHRQLAEAQYNRSLVEIGQLVEVEEN